MTAITAQDRAAIRETSERLLADLCTQARVRAAMATPSGRDEELWRQLSRSGFVGLLAPEAFGGIGGDPQLLERVMEEAGAVLMAGPFFSSAVLATSLLTASANREARARLLPAIVSGETIATVALTGAAVSWCDEDIMVVARQEDGAVRLDGHAAFVTDGAQADLLIVLARDAGGIAAFEICDRAGLSIEALSCVDRTLRLAHLTLEGVRATPVADADAVAHMRAMALLARAGMQVGAARRIFDITIDYIKARVQFGRIVGGFQAIKHMAADLLIEMESAATVARAAALSLAEGRDDAQELLTLAAFTCSDAFVRVAHDAILMHGGIAFTWEHPAHLYLRRARASAQLLGASALYRDRYLAIRENAA